MNKIELSGGWHFPVIGETEHYVMCLPPTGGVGVVTEKVALQHFEETHRQGYRLAAIQSTLGGARERIFFEKPEATS